MPKSTAATPARPLLPHVPDLGRRPDVRHRKPGLPDLWLRSVRDRLVVSGGFPRQDISSSGKGQGITWQKSGLWFHMARIIGEILPAFAFVENSPLLATRGLEEILASLAEMGYDAKWCVLGAGHLNYPIKRDRIWILGQHHSHHGWMTPGQGKAQHVNSMYGAQRKSLLCQMLIRLDLWPTALLVERLMGWPDRWTDPKPLAMDKYRQWLHSHGGY